MPTPISFADVPAEAPGAPVPPQLKRTEPVPAMPVPAAPGWLGPALSLWQRQPQAREISPDTLLSGH